MSVPPGYGYGYPPPYQPPRQTNTLAIVALVTAFLFAPLGIIFGIIAKRQIKQTGEDGEGFALAGIVIGIVFTLMFVLGMVMFIIFIAAANDFVTHVTVSTFTTTR